MINIGGPSPSDCACSGVDATSWQLPEQRPSLPCQDAVTAVQICLTYNVGDNNAL